MLDAWRHRGRKARVRHLVLTDSQSFRRRGGGRRDVCGAASLSRCRRRRSTASPPMLRTATAVARIFAAKGRPRFNPLICHVTDIAMARRYGVLDARAECLGGKVLAGAAVARRAACGRCAGASARHRRTSDDRASRAARAGARRHRRARPGNRRAVGQPLRLASARRAPSM